MAQVTFSVRMDEQLKKQMDEICNEFGMTTSTAFNIFARAVVRERRIPFEIKAKEEPFSKERALEIMEKMRAEALRNGTADMSLEEINAEIKAVRNGK